MAIYGILLIYNKDYRLNAINAFNNFFNNLGPINNIIIVNNNDDNINQGEISGDNTNWEFSGWDKGISLLKIEDNDVIVFANDTFLTHRSWGKFDQLRFKKSINKLIVGNNQGICGEVHKFSGFYKVFGYRSDRWVCTYLFALTGGIVNKINKISLSEIALSKAIIGIENHNILWGDEVSLNLQYRIQRWLYPPVGILGWRKANDATDNIKLRKAKTILNEKWLSAYCYSNNLIVIDAGPNNIIKIYRKTKYRLRELINIIKILFKRFTGV
jgi:hypothetical protein